jgi:hypothetical protein
MTARDAELNSRLQRWLFAGIAAAVGLEFAVVWSDYIAAGNGTFVYWIEDAYIHLATARTLVESGVWGVTPHEFTSSSSSPLWVLLLAAGMWLAGPDVTLAFALNLFATLGLAAIVAHVLASSATTKWARWLAVVVAGLIVLVVAPLPQLLTGMEHLGHAALMLLAVWWLSRRLSDDGPRVGDAPLLIVLLILPLWRYESLWLHALGALVALARGERRIALMIGAAGAVPVLAFGLFNQANGWPFLPAPLLTKTIYLADGGGNWLVWLAKYFLWWPLKRLFLYVPELLVMMVAADCWLAWSLWRDPTAWRRQRWLAVLFFLLGSWAHATVAAFGWGGRYELYLLALGLVSLGVALPTTDWRALAQRTWRLILVGVLMALFTLAAGHRTWKQHDDLAGAAETVALRDVWHAVALSEYCGANPCELRVMAMNIGALSWYAGPRLTDLLALADREVLTLVRDRRLDSAAVRRLADGRQVDVAFIFDDWYATAIGGGPPLVKVATYRQNTDWPTPLSIYVRDATDAARIAQGIRRMVRSAPPRLTVEFDPAFR